MTIREEIISELTRIIKTQRSRWGEGCVSDLCIDEVTDTAYFFNYYHPDPDEEQDAPDREPDVVEEFALDARLTRSRICQPGYLWSEWEEW